MSSTPVSTGHFSIFEISEPSRWASGTPRRLMPTSPRFSQPSCFSTISWARRTSVRSISEADMRRPFSRSLGLLSGSLSVLLVWVVSLIAIALDDISSPASIEGAECRVLHRNLVPHPQKAAHSATDRRKHKQNPGDQATPGKHHSGAKLGRTEETLHRLCLGIGRESMLDLQMKLLGQLGVETSHIMQHIARHQAAGRHGNRQAADEHDPDDDADPCTDACVHPCLGTPLLIETQ